MRHKSWGWKGHFDERWRLRRRAAFNGSQVLLCSVLYVGSGIRMLWGCAFLFRVWGPFVVFSVVLYCMVSKPVYFLWWWLLIRVSVIRVSFDLLARSSILRLGLL